MALPAKLKADQHFTDTKDYFLEHLKKNSYALDPEAKAIVLYECANFSLINNVEGWYVKRHVRKVIKVLNKNGISEADVMVPFNRTDRSYIKDLKGKTYNLENNNVVIKEIDKSAVHVDVINSNAFMAKFSMPAVKEGSIIDYYYEIQESVGMVFAHWEFQEDIPKIYSEANAVYHDAFRVMEVTQTNKSFKQYEILPQDVSIDELPEAYMVTTGKTKGDYYSQKWVRRNISAMVEEPFVYNTDNYSELLELHVGGVS